MSLIRRVPGVVGRRDAVRLTDTSWYLRAVTGLGIKANDPIVLAVRGKRDASTNFMGYISIGEAGFPNDFRQVSTLTDPNEVAVRSYTNAAFAAELYSSGSAFTAGSGWHSLLGEFASGSSRRIIVDGVAFADTTAASLTDDPGEIHVGTNFTDGAIAQVAIFAGVASSAFVALHVAGVHPTQLPAQLVECWDLDHIGPIIGLVRGTVLSPVIGATLTVGPQVQGPPRLRRVFVGAPASVTYDTFRPSGTLSAGTWAPYPSGTLHGVTSDEDDATYAESSTGAGSDTLDLSFPAMGTPPAGTVTFYVRHMAGDDTDDITGSGDLSAPGGTGSGTGTVT